VSFFLHSQEWLCHGVILAGFDAFQQHARSRQVTKNQWSDTTRRRRRDMAPIIGLEPAPAKRHFPNTSFPQQERQTNAKNASVCLPTARDSRDAHSPTSVIGRFM
jgi:hypothetical protein